MEHSKIDIGKTIDTKLSGDITITLCDTTVGIKTIFMETWMTCSVLHKKQNPRSPNGPPMVKVWVVRIFSGWSVTFIEPWATMQWFAGLVKKDVTPVR